MMCFLLTDGYLVLESRVFPGQHVGILPNGSAKPPNQTGTGDHARFCPKVIQPSPYRTFIAGRGRLQVSTAATLSP